MSNGNDVTSDSNFTHPGNTPSSRFQLLLTTIISGGQTGVDRGALDAALQRDFGASGYCPKGRRAEDGVIPDKYPLIEISSCCYDDRTRYNVDRSDGTLILFWGMHTSGRPTTGTRMTLEYCKKTHPPRPQCVIDLHLIREWDAVNHIVKFLIRYGIRRLNVAGPRASKWAEGHEVTQRILTRVINIQRFRNPCP